MMTLLRTATPAAGTVTVKVVPVLVDDVVPIVLTKEICAAAWELGKASSTAIAIKQRRCMFILNFSLKGFSLLNLG
jgi:hypothetical protein